jgi:glutamyl endopeptidase
MKVLFASTVLLATAALASAQPQDPHTPVSSDGSASPRAELATMNAMNATMSESFEGLSPELGIGARFDETGAVVDGAEEVTESAQDVWALWEAGASSPRGLWGGSIIGPDSRTLVSPTTAYPARAIGLVTVTGGSCTGWLINKDTVVTAGHCVHSGGTSGAWRANVRFYPGRNGASSPYGSCSARRLHSVSGWLSSADERYDYGAIKLNCTVGNTTGWFGFFWQSATLTGLPTTVAGYPDDKPVTQWKATGTVAVTQDRQVFYKNDTRPGQSGAPVYYNRTNCGTCSMAIHAYGVHGSSPHSTNNHATRIVKAVFDNLVAWKNAL